MCYPYKGQIVSLANKINKTVDTFESFDPKIAFHVQKYSIESKKHSTNS